MIRWIVRSSLQFRRLVVAVAAGLIVFGAVQVTNTPVDALPEFSPPTVEVQTEALGLSAAEVEQLITAPLEQDLLVGVPFLDEIESVSMPGLSSVVMIFEPGTDVLDARQVVQERLTQAVGVAGLPAVAKPPQMIQPLSSTGRVSMVKLTSQSLSPIDMSVLARWVIAPKLLGVSGVANVAIWGNRDRQLQVQVDPERLRDNGVTLSQVIRTSGNALEVSPLSFLEASTPGTGGFIDTPNQRLNIFHEQAISTPDELAQVPLERPDGEVAAGGGGESFVLGDVANVVEDHQPLIGDAACASGGDCLLLVIEKFPGANTLEVSEGVGDAIDDLEPGLAGLRMDTSTYEPASYLTSSFDHLGWVLLAALVLLVLVLVAFSTDWRRVVIVLATMASALAVALLVLQVRDTTVNLMVVCGLVLGLAALIDDAVGDVDEIATRLRWLRETETGGSVWSTIVEASVAARGAILTSVLILAAAALPLFFLSGEAGAFLPPIALSYLLAVGASMLVALTVTPALGMLLLAGAPLKRRQSRAVAWMRRRYDGMAPRLMLRTGVALAVLVGVTAAGLVAVPFLESSLRPSLQERDVLVHLSAEPGTSLPKMNEAASQAVEQLTALPDVEDVNAQVGRAVMSDQVVDVNEGEIWIRLDDEVDYDSAVASIERTVDGFSGLETDVSTYTDERVGDVLQRDDDDVVVRVYGENSDVLATKADEVQALIAGTDGVTRAEAEKAAEEPTYEVEADLERSQALGIKPGDVRRTAASLMGGITVGNLFEEQKVFDVVVWGTPAIRQTRGDIEDLLIDAPGGRSVRLGDVAEVREVPNASVIRHESVTKYVEVTADVAGRDVEDVTSEVDAALKDIDFPLDHHAEVIGSFAERQADRDQLIAVGVAAAIAIFLLLQAAFRSWRVAALVFVLLPASLSGALLAALATGGTVTLGTVAGCLVVLGVATRGAMGLVRHFQYLERREGMELGPELVVRGTGERVAPMLTSVLATAAVLLPIAVVGVTSGLELLHPAAVATLGGLVTATVMILVVLPIGYARIASGRDHDSWADELMTDVAATHRAEV
jgi:Cu/Ag efflux pump CusA